MQINYQLSEKDFVQAYRAHRDRTTLGKWTGRIVLWGSTLFVVSMLIGLVAQHDDRVARSYLPIPCLTLIWFLILDMWPRWAMKRQFRKQPGAQGPRTVTFDANGAHWRWDGGSGDIAWKNYIRWVEGKNQILFYTSPACFSIVPKQDLTQEQIADLRELLKQNIPVMK